MAIRRIIQSSISGGTDSENVFLHTKSLDVVCFDEKLCNVIRDLRDTLWAYPICVGLSAPQISEPYRISVINLRKETKDEDLVLINPRIVSESGKKDKKRESCMSVWGYLGEVERRYKIEIEYQDINQKHITASFEGFAARAIHHEIDHLDGILYNDILTNGTNLSSANLFDGYQILNDD